MMDRLLKKLQSDWKDKKPNDIQKDIPVEITKNFVSG